jgi:3-methyladenine DNA glycosylase/8-oxoguanine DNA glycosylase
MASNSPPVPFSASRLPRKERPRLAGRWASAFGKPFPGPSRLTHLFPSPEVLAGATLSSVGLGGARAETIRALARAVCAGKINFEGVVDCDTFLGRLCEIPGIGKWTAQYVVMRALGEPDAFPSSGLGLLRGTLAAKRSRELEHRAATWRPRRAYASLYLWRIAAQSGNKQLPRKPQKPALEGTGTGNLLDMVV